MKSFGNDQFKLENRHLLSNKNSKHVISNIGKIVIKVWIVCLKNSKTIIKDICTFTKYDIFLILLFKKEEQYTILNIR